MAKYLFVYHGGTKPADPKEIEAEMAKWGAWFGGIGDAIVDGGNPVGKSTTVTAAGVANDGGANPVSGYSLFNFENLDDAIATAKGCPILEGGGSVEIAETFEM